MAWRQVAGPTDAPRPFFGGALLGSAAFAVCCVVLAWDVSHPPACASCWLIRNIGGPITSHPGLTQSRIPHRGSESGSWDSDDRNRSKFGMINAAP